jgi:beta-galactosidase
MQLGTAYYPEHHSADVWPIDYRLLREAGIRTIRIAEFAWSSMEPMEGEYRWEWLDDAITLAQEHGIQVVLCTPTACPPIWLAEKYPEILPVGKNGKTIGFGARQHRSYHSSKYIEYSMKITRLMAERYGNHPNVVAWQLDNEFGGETKYDFGDCAKRAFSQYLSDKYGSIDELNRRWGTAFWSQHYHRFDQIPLPAPIDSDVMMWPHPSVELEFARFSSEGMTKFADMQTEILRAYIGDRPITTNAFMFRWGDNIDWTKLFKRLDVVGMDIYSNSPHEIAFYCDACRGVLSKPFWMMEYGSGAAELERDMEAISQRGCSQFFLFKMKPFPWGQEQGGGQPELLTMTGEPSANYHAVQRYANCHAEGEFIMPKPSKVGLYYHFASSWSYRVAVSDRVAYPDYVVDTVYKALYELEQSVDVLYTPDQIDGQDIVIIPLHILHDAELERKLEAFVRAGGQLIVTDDLFRKNADNVFLTERPALFSSGLEWTTVARGADLNEWRNLLSDKLL